MTVQYTDTTKKKNWTKSPFNTRIAHRVSLRNFKFHDLCRSSGAVVVQPHLTIDTSRETWKLRKETLCTILVLGSSSRTGDWAPFAVWNDPSLQNLLSQTVINPYHVMSVDALKTEIWMPRVNTKWVQSKPLGFKWSCLFYPAYHRQFKDLYLNQPANALSVSARQAFFLTLKFSHWIGERGGGGQLFIISLPLISVNANKSISGIHEVGCQSSTNLTLRF